MKITNCSMGCMYATGPLFKCLCTCGGTTHGLMVPQTFAQKCSPAVEKRCKAGNEDGECRCACKGVNHGLYKTIGSFETIQITGMVA